MKEINKKTNVSLILKVLQWCFCAVMLACVCVLIFYNLNADELDSWDESRHGVNAYEMAQSGEYIVATYRGETELWNLKPPLSTWCIAASYKMFGYTNLSLRLYSAISMLVIVLLSAGYALKRYGLTSCMAVLAFTASCGTYYFHHFARNGDADALFVMFCVIFGICMMELERHPKLIYICGLSFSFAFLAKGWHSFALVAIGILYIIIRKLWKNYSIKQWLIFVACAGVPSLTWAILRFAKDGLVFFKGMVGVDLIARTTTTLENHVGGPMFYYDFLINDCNWMVYPLALILLGAGAYLFAPKLEKLSGEATALILWATVPIFLFSVVSTKILWYIFLSIPAIILLAAKAIGYVIPKLPTDKIKKVVVVSIVLLPIILSLRCIQNNWLSIEAADRDIATNTIRNAVQRTDKYDEMPAYIQDAQNIIEWEQNQVLAAQTAGNLNPIDGGIGSFMEQNSHAILFLAKNTYDATSDMYVGMTVTKGVDNPYEPDDCYYIIEK